MNELSVKCPFTTIEEMQIYNTTDECHPATCGLVQYCSVGCEYVRNIINNWEECNVY